MGPAIVVLAGPNGAGKSTHAGLLLEGVPFVNADAIAKQLPATVGRNRDMAAARVLLERLEDLA